MITHLNTMHFIRLRATNTRLGQLKRPIRSRTTTVSSSTKVGLITVSGLANAKYFIPHMN